MTFEKKSPPSAFAAGFTGESSWPRLSAAAYAVFETGQLLDPDGPARMEPSGRYSDLGAEAEFATVGELRRSVVQNYG
jgi:hypothetical protein